MGVLLQLAQLVTENQCSHVNIAHVRRQSLPLQRSLYHVSKVTKRNIAFRNFV